MRGGFSPPASCFMNIKYFVSTYILDTGEMVYAIYDSASKLVKNADIFQEAEGYAKEVAAFLNDAVIPVFENVKTEWEYTPEHLREELLYEFVEERMLDEYDHDSIKEKLLVQEVTRLLKLNGYHIL